jgi:uncharacterized Tic20 family protein
MADTKDPSAASPAEEPIRIPVDAPAPNDDIDELVREYEEQYYGFRDKEKPRIMGAVLEAPPKPKRSPASQSFRSAAVTDDERMWAAIAHGSAWLTLLLGTFTGGLAALFTLFIPLGIYFAYRQRSEYVAYHALQAFAIQVLGTVGWVAVLTAGMLIGGLLCAVLAITLIGIPLIVVVAIVMALFAVASLGMPLGMLVFSVIASWRTYQGKWYRYPYIGDWIDRQMHSGFLATL